jgi:hypothetical protein
VKSVCLVGEFDMHRIAVLVGINGNRGYSRIASGSRNANGNLAAVGDKHLGYLF